MTAEKQIKVAAKLYEMRQFAHDQLGDLYSCRVGMAQVVLASWTKAGAPLMSVGLSLMKSARTPLDTAVFAAAIVDTTEGIDHSVQP